MRGSSYLNLSYRMLASRRKHYLRSANQARDEGAWEKAASHYSAFLKSNPDAFGIWVQLGHAEKEQKRYSEAFAAYKQAELLRCDDLDLKIQIGHLLKDTGKESEALAYYQAAVAAGSDDAHAKAFISASNSGMLHASISEANAKREDADAARDMGDLDLAAKLYAQAVEIDGNDSNTFVQLGNCFKDLKRFEAAEKAYSRALDLRPDDADCYLQLGHLMKLMDRFDQAISYYTQSDILDPSRLDAQLELERLQSSADHWHAPVDLSPPPPPMPPASNISERAEAILSRYHDALSRRRH